MQRSNIIPYEGTKPYVFVSYAHKDSHLVMPVLERLYAMGYRIWFDDGIAPGSEWPENIARHLNDCALTMAFVSPNSIASDNCRREVTFALSKRKPFLGVILQKTEMSLGMEMQLSAQQCVLKYAYQREEDFIQKICTCPDLEPCLDMTRKQEAAAQQEDKGETETQQNVNITAEATAQTNRGTSRQKLKKEKTERNKVKRVQKQKTGKGGKKTLAIIGAAVAAIVIVCVLLSALTHVQITESKRVSTGDIYLSLSGETVTEEMAGKISRMKKLENISFRDCTFQPGALAAMKLPEQLKDFSAVECSGLEDLTFLQNLPNLTGLTLESCGITDASLPEMNLSKLRRLNLSENADVTALSKLGALQSLTELDISGTGVKALEELENPSLTKINFSNTEIADVKPLARMEGLTNIQGSDTQVSNIDDLASLEKLTVLNFGNCRIASVNAPFASLRLSQLWLENNGLTGLDAFSDCTVLTRVGLAGNRLTDVSVLEKSAGTLTYLSLSGNELTYENLEFLEDTVKMKELYLDGIPMWGLGFAENMVELEKLTAIGCGLADISGLKNSTKLTCLRLANNRIKEITALRDISPAAAMTLDLSYNQLHNVNDLPKVRYGVLALYGEGVDLETLPEVEGRVLCVSYQPGLEETHLAQKTFSYYNILGCPADETVKTEDLLGKFRIRLLEDTDALIARMEEDGLDYSFLKEMEYTEE